MLRLYINNVEVQLTDDVDFTLNKYFEDTAKPTNKYIEFSKTIVIPFSLINNKLFGSIYCPDRVITYDNNNNFVGIHFDPYKKLDMRLEDDDNVLLQGYAKMLYIDDKGYSLGLYGELGKVFGELNKLTFDATKYKDDDVKYYIDGSEYYSETINRNLIYNSWNNEKDSINPELRKRTDSNYTAYSVVGWTPLNIKTDSDTFDQKTFDTDKGSKSFTEVLESLSNPTFADATRCNADTAIGDGLKPRDIGEFRSYLQQPFMYFDKFYQLLGVKCKELTGYEFVGDNSWFNVNNPYYNDLVFTLKNFEKEDDFVSNGYNPTFTGMVWAKDTSNYSVAQTGEIRFTTDFETKPIYNSSQNMFATPYPNVGFSMDMEFFVRVPYFGLPKDAPMFIGVHNALIIEISTANTVPSAKQYSTYVVYSSRIDSDVLNALRTIYNDAVLLETSDFTVDDEFYTLNFTVNGGFYSYSELQNVKFYIDVKWYNSTYPLSLGKNISSIGLYTQVDNNNMAVNVYENYNRSGSSITLNTLWNNEYQPFDLLMNYCKMFRIGMFADNIKKQIKFVPYSTYFSNYTIADWTDKLDKTLEYQIKPITYENKWVKFNYADNSSNVNELYKNKFALNFGEYNIDTHYVFNNETEELFEDIKCPVENTDNVLSWNNLYNNKKIVYSFPAEKYICPKDKDDKLIDNFGTFYFDGGCVYFDTEEALQLRNTYVSDDSQTQRGSGKFYYSQGVSGNAYITRTTKYHQLSTFASKYMVTYTVPSYSFCWQDYAGKQGLYEAFWKNYLQERYDVQNKIVTCYLRLKNTDFINFEFNKFIVIDNQLYFVNKIFDFNPSDNEATKVELITVQNIQGYAKDNFNPYLSITPTSLSMYRADDRAKITVESTQRVSVTANTGKILKIDGKTIPTAIGTGIYEGTHYIQTVDVPSSTTQSLVTFKSAGQTKTLTINYKSGFITATYQDAQVLTQTIKNNDSVTIHENGILTINSSSAGTWNSPDATSQGLYLNGVDGTGTFNKGVNTFTITFDSSSNQSGDFTFTNNDGGKLKFYMERENAKYLRIYLNSGLLDNGDSVEVSQGDYFVVESSSSGKWDDISGALQGLSLNGENGSGVFGAGRTAFAVTLPYGTGDRGELGFGSDDGFEYVFDVTTH